MEDYGLSSCLCLLGVARSTYYYQLKKPYPLSKYEHLRGMIEGIIKKNPAYGYRRIKAELASSGIIINHKPLRKLLVAWKLNLKRKVKPRRKSGIERILEELGQNANLLIGSGAPKPFTVVYSDITEICYANGKVYLAACLEAASKCLLGYSISSSPGSRLVVSAYKNTAGRLKRLGAALSSVIFHQDQGSVYTGYDYVSGLVSDGAKISYSRIATPSDNPDVESFFGRFKDEKGDEFAQAETEVEVMKLINEALLYYNGKRRHSSIGYLNPEEFIRRELALNAG